VNTSARLLYGYTPFLSGLIFCNLVLQLSKGNDATAAITPEIPAAVTLIAYQLVYPFLSIDSLMISFVVNIAMFITIALITVGREPLNQPLNPSSVYIFLSVVKTSV